MNQLRNKWEEFRQLFIAAHHNPVARRREDDEYSAACRQAFDELVVLMQAYVADIVSSPSPSDLIALATSQIVNDPEWMVKAGMSGHMVDIGDIPALNGVIGNQAPISVEASSTNSAPRLRTIPE